MTDKISKQLAKFSDKERGLVKEILLKLRRGDAKGLQIAKLKDHQDIYRIRKGRLRIIYQQDQQDAIIKVLAIERRSEKTYKDF